VSYIYFVREESRGNIKIGITSEPTLRLSQLQSGNPDVLNIEGIANGGPLSEYALHVKFSEHQIHGEWFHPAHEVLDFMQSLPTYDEYEAGEPLPDLDSEFEIEAAGFKLAGIKPRRRRKKRY